MSQQSMRAAAELALRENTRIVQGDARGPTVEVDAAQLKNILEGIAAIDAEATKRQRAAASVADHRFVAGLRRAASIMREKAK